LFAVAVSQVPAAQVKPHWPAVQVAVALAGAGHGEQDVPQEWGLESSAHWLPQR
jgi:hypothetical protein